MLFSNTSFYTNFGTLTTGTLHTIGPDFIYLQSNSVNDSIVDNKTTNSPQYANLCKITPEKPDILLHLIKTSFTTRLYYL